MELYVVFEMAQSRDIMVAVFLDYGDADEFVKSCRMESRYLVAIPATDDTLLDWYNFRATASNVIDNPQRVL